MKDSENDKLLTRRQVLGLFGASTGAAIVGTGAANLESGDGQGNLYGGVAEMAEPHKIGENMWKGPLSVRSDIPKRDGNDFIQTDAGPSNNQYAMQHYNGGWSKQGLDAQSVSTEEQNSSVYYVHGDRLVDVRDVLNNKVPSGGGATICLLAKDYNFDFLNEKDANDNGLTIDKPNIHLTGAGWSSRIFLEDNTTETDTGANILSVQANNVTISNLQIDGNWHNNNPGETGTVEDGHNIDTVNANNFSMFNVLSRRSTGDGVELLSNSENNRVRGCWFLDNWEHSIGLNGCRKAIIDGCFFHTETNNAIIGTWNGSGNPDTEDVLIANSTLFNPGDRGLNITSGGGKTSGITVSNVRIYANNSGKYPIRIVDGSGGTPPEDIELYNVKVYNAPAHAVLIDNANAKLLDVTVDTAQRAGFSVSDPQRVELVRPEVIDANQGTTNNDHGISATTSVTGATVSIDSPTVRKRSGTSRAVNRGISFGGGGSWSGESRLTEADIGANQNGPYGMFVSVPYVRDNAPAAPQDLTTITANEDGQAGWHDGTNGASTNVAGPAKVIGGSWTSLVDGTTIS